MELLYLIDRTITRLIQAIAGFFTRRLRLQLGWQRAGMFLVGVSIGILSSTAYSEKPPESDVMRSVAVGGCWLASTVATAILLKYLHLFFDPENARRPDKLYEDGYKCWADIAVTFLWILIGTQVGAVWINALFAQSIGLLGFIGYDDFVNRRRGPGGKKHPGALTAAMRRLLERVKRLTYRPRPVYNPQ